MKIVKGVAARKPQECLHLPSLSIRAFRGIRRLSMPRLGRVTLLAGKNGVGKTTVLDAIRIYAARGRHSTLLELAQRREEFTTFTDEDGDRVIAPDLSTIFHEGDTSRHGYIAIGPAKRKADELKIERASPDDEHFIRMEKLVSEKLADYHLDMFKVVFRDSEHVLPPVQLPHEFVRFRRMYDADWPPAIKLESLGPGLPSTDDMERFWRDVALTEEEDLALRALKLFLGSDVSRVAVVGDERGGLGVNGQRVLVKLKHRQRPIPLRSLGDGAVRSFGIALALANCRDGLLLIDEAENGIHHTMQSDFWRLILRAAHESNVQVIATTHGLDCIRGFAQAATELNHVEGVLFRLEREDDHTRVVEYREEKLMTAVRHDIETR